MTQFFVLDTTVLAHLTKVSHHTPWYRELLDNAVRAVSFQTEAELLAADYSPLREIRVQTVLARTVRIPHSHAASQRYAATIRRRNELRRSRSAGSDASDADVWTIAAALEHNAALVSHDAQQVALARAMSVDAFTALPQLRAANPS